MKNYRCNALRSGMAFGLMFVLSFSAAARWNPTNGPWDGCVSTMFFFSDTLFAAVYPDELYRSIDNGVSWLHTGWNDDSWITASVRDGDKLYGGTASGNVFLSVDGGDTWMRADSGLPSSAGITAFSVNGSFVFAGCYHGVYRAPRSDPVWTEVNSGLHDRIVDNYVNCLFSHGSVIVAGTGDGVFRSEDNGAHWLRINSPFSNTFVSSIAALGGRLIVAAPDGLYISTDDGISWSPILEQPPRDVSGYRLSVAGTKVFAAGVPGLFVSDDTGSVWKDILNAPAPCAGVACNITTGRLFCVGRGGIYLTDDPGRSWIEGNTGIANMNVTALGCAGGSVIAGNSIGQIYLTDDQGRTWTRVFDDSAAGTICSFWNLGQVLYAGCNGYGLLQSTDGGVRWSKGPDQLTDIRAGSGTVMKPVYCIKQTGGWLFAATSRGVFRSRGMDSLWEEVNSGVSIQTIEIRGEMVFAASLTDGVYRSVNYGETWVKVNTGLPNSKVRSFAVAGGTLLVLLFDGSVYKKDINGERWLAVMTGENVVRQGAALVSQNGILFLLSGDGVRGSFDDGMTWHDRSDGLSDNSAAAILCAGEECYLGTAGYGMWTRPLRELLPASGVPAVRKRSRQDAGLRITDTYMSVTIPAASPLSLSVVDVSGRTVAAFVNKEFPVGTCRFRWRDASVAAGVYCVELRGGTFGVLRGMVAVK